MGITTLHLVFYLERYKDPKRVEQLLEVEAEMLNNYKYAALISWPDLTADFCENKVRKIAEKKAGNTAILRERLRFWKISLMEIGEKRIL
ncbi:hypothetical protein [Acetobacterium woodii]|uniref:Uncharacterized protein n=1 Tax=Acetobacterium woodii (strain ATCC 29683 / DSM 1030 / JCM 2381 / KCTC 1655 / WB1) TaxID=931626 RepID=H6LK50_ACEWD|nr:hypothetical protein [Acetobacterium woodii]AFA49970.1 hypothetical protein Awo_c32420 [Acetobacterium woodii DSM 1030]